MKLILQPYGLGDIIFIQTLVTELAKGDKVFWPVQEPFLEGLCNAYPNVYWIPEPCVKQELMERKVKHEKVGVIDVYGIRYAEWLMGRQYKDHMRSKYELYDLDWNIWKRNAMPQRNLPKELELMEVLGIKMGDPYNLIATKFGGSREKEIEIKLNNGIRNVNLTAIPGFSLFDWCSVIQHATMIHAVSSSTLYLFEILDMKASQIHLYPRKPREQDFTYTKFLFTKNYTLHD